MKRTSGARRCAPADVPGLPVERGPTPECGHGRCRRGTCHDDRADQDSDESAPDGGRTQDQRDGQCGRQGERSGDDGRAAERCRPADSGHGHGSGTEWTPRSDEQRGREDEAEDRAENERVHLRVGTGLERQEDRVEVDDAAPGVSHDRSDDALVAKRQELPWLRPERDPDGTRGGERDRRKASPGPLHERRSRERAQQPQRPRADAADPRGSATRR